MAGGTGSKTWRAGALALLALAGSSRAAPQEPLPRPDPRRGWDARAAEHLLNRAAFGARPDEIARAVAAGREAAVEALLAGQDHLEQPFYSRIRNVKGDGVALRRMTPEERFAEVRRMRAADQQQLIDFLEWWVGRMVAGEDALRERMTLFWHGHFTSSQQDVQNSHEMILQNQLLREHALGNFGRLLRLVARDAAMIEYLDVASNRKEHPNENFARELMELFTLGEGNYTESDVKEAARAFTGWADRNGRFVFRMNQHDDGQKTVLGVTGDLDGDDVIDVLLAEEACARHLARRLLAWFEGVEPEPCRLEAYATALREADYEIRPFLGRLFLDPAFYRDEVVGTRIAGPIDFVVGAARRLGSDPPATFLLAAASLLGQRLFFPPNVEGWEEGEAWLTTASLMQRSNLAGVMLGVVTVDELAGAGDDAMAAATTDGTTMEESDGASMEGEAMDEAAPAAGRARAAGRSREMRGLRQARWLPSLNLTARLARPPSNGLASDEEIAGRLADELLAVELAPGTRAALAQRLREERRRLGIRAGALLADPELAEPVLRRLAHLILSLPEAQLH